MLALAWLIGCGGVTKSSPHWIENDAGVDAGSDAGVDAGSDAGVDAGGEFCSGPSKVELGSRLALGVPVTTSSVPVLNCCETAVLRLHAKSALGSDYDLALRIFGFMEVGAHAVGPNESYTATLRPPGGDLWQDPNVTGSVVVHQAGGDVPTRLSLCLTVDAPGDPLQGMRVWLDEASIAPYSWEQRFGLRLAADPALSAAEAAKVGLAGLETEQTPTLGLGSIGFYQASAHRFGWAPALGQSKALLAKLGKVGVGGRPFVIEADGERIYLGAFMTSVSSVGVDMPAIVIEQIDDAGFVVDDAYPPGAGSGPDPRNDSRILKVLGEAQKLVP